MTFILFLALLPFALGTIMAICIFAFALITDIPSIMKGFKLLNFDKNEDSFRLTRFW